MKPGARVLELLATPGRSDIQACVIRDSAGFDSAEAQAPRIVIVYQSSSGVRRALNLARHLAVGETAVWVVCPAANSPFGHFRFIRFVNLVGRLMNETSITGLRISFLAVPCSSQAGATRFVLNGTKHRSGGVAIVGTRRKRSKALLSYRSSFHDCLGHISARRQALAGSRVQRISNIASTSTATPVGSEANPRALRA